jgi:hypothetical protein
MVSHFTPSFGIDGPTTDDADQAAGQHRSMRHVRQAGSRHGNRFRPTTSRSMSAM